MANVLMTIIVNCRLQTLVWEFQENGQDSHMLLLFVL